MTIPRLILGSTSAYRKALLDQLGIKFCQQAPTTDETPAKSETACHLAARLAAEKARSVGDRQPVGDDWIVIASDQVCHLEGQIYGKPGNFDLAMRQLQQFSGQWVTFSTALTLLSSEGRQSSGIEDYEILFKQLSNRQIESYLHQDQPWDCAGSIKVEKAGITLLNGTKGRDINTLYGLPLMLLTERLLLLGHGILDFK